MLLRILAAVAAVAGIGLASAQLPDFSARTQSEAFVPDPQTAQLLSFGFDSVMGDLHWLRAVQIVGSPQGASGRNSLLASLIDVVTTLDPWVDHPYRFAAVWLTDDETSVRKSNELIRRGIAHHPDDWRGYFYLAFNHMFFLGEEPEAALALAPAVNLDGAPPYLTRLLARLKSSTGGLDASAAFLHEMSLQAASDDERERYQKALDEVETERRARFLDSARIEYVRRNKRDIARVEDLVTGGVLRELPPEPFGAGWKISDETGQIVSSHVRYRYGVKIDGTNRKMIEAFRARSRSVRGE